MINDKKINSIKNKRKYSVILSVFTMFSIGSIILFHNLTINIIEQGMYKRKIELLDQIIPKSLYNNHLLNECYLIINPILGDISPHKLYLAKRDKTIVAEAIEFVTHGYSSIIKLIVGINSNGSILGVRVISHNETPGIGDKIDLHFSNWITQFTGKLVNSNNDKEWKMKKDGGTIDQFTGATITLRAVVNSTKKTGEFLKKNFYTLDNQHSCYHVKYE